MSLFPKHISQAAQATPAPQSPLPLVGFAGATTASSSPPPQALSTPEPIAVPGMVRPYLAHQGAAHVAANGAIARYGAPCWATTWAWARPRCCSGSSSERIANGGYAIMVAPPVAKAGYQGDLIAAFPHLRFAHLQGRTPDFANLPIADIYFISDDTLTMQAWLTTSVTEHRGGKLVKVLQANAFASSAAIITRDELHRDKGNKGKPTGRAKVMAAVGEAARAKADPHGRCDRHPADEPPRRGVPAAAGPRRRGPGPGHHARCEQGQRLPLALLQPGPEAHRHARTVTDFGTDFARLPELHDALRSTVYVRREKSDLPDGMLPHSRLDHQAHRPERRAAHATSASSRTSSPLVEARGPRRCGGRAKAEAIVQMTKLWQEAGGPRLRPLSSTSPT